MYRILLYTFLDREDSLVDQALAVAIGGAPVRLYPDLCVQGRYLFDLENTLVIPVNLRFGFIVFIILSTALAFLVRGGCR